MRREKKLQAKTKLIADIMNYIANGHMIDETGAMARQLCKCYFPNADKIMVNEVEVYAITLQEYYYANMCIDECIGKYKEIPTQRHTDALRRSDRACVKEICWGHILLGESATESHI